MCRWRRRPAALIGACAIRTVYGPEKLEEALGIARTIRSDGVRAKPLLSILQQMSEDRRAELLEEAWTAACGIEEATARATALKGLIEYLPGIGRAACHRLWRGTLGSSARRAREDLLADIACTAELLVQLGGTEAVWETVQAISDVARWMP
jgi:hypothetical protein